MKLVFAYRYRFVIDVVFEVELQQSESMCKDFDSVFKVKINGCYQMLYFSGTAIYFEHNGNVFFFSKLWYLRFKPDLSVFLCYQKTMLTDRQYIKATKKEYIDTVNGNLLPIGSSVVKWNESGEEVVEYI